MSTTAPANNAIPPPDDRTRNPHPDFKLVESQRPDFDTASTFRYTKTPNPDWHFGDGANFLHQTSSKPGSSSAATGNDPPEPSRTDAAPTVANHISFSPYEPGRPIGFNYKLLISGVVPRPIAFVSTRSADGSVTNLAPFSYFSLINHDPPLLTVGFARGLDAPKDTLRNLLETRECVVNIISESFVEAANACAVNAPYGLSEWPVSGLTPAYDCVDVKCARVKEAIFSVEGKLDFYREYKSNVTGKPTGCLCVIEGTRFWVREDAINDDGNIIDPTVLRPISRLGGIMYGRLTEAFEIPRADFEKDVKGAEGYEEIAKKSS